MPLTVTAGDAGAGHEGCGHDGSGHARSNSLSVIDTTTDTVVKTVVNVGVEPRGLAITNDGDADDLDEKVVLV